MAAGELDMMSGVEIFESPTRHGPRYKVHRTRTAQREKGWLFKRTVTEVTEEVLVENKACGGELMFIDEEFFPYASGCYVAYFPTKKDARSCATRVLAGAA